MTSESDDPLIKALPPATDYLTYLTLLEYQLTPARLPTLHRLLQDEVLTTNIGWDLVQILLPMLPESQDCLQDVARLGNPREVILRVSDSLMKLEPGHDDDEDEGVTRSISNIQKPEATKLPRHVIQFNCLVAMLSVLHRRIKTKYPSRFIATSLQAALEAYSSMPTNETTNAFLEFLRDLSPSKRPTLPPRGTSSSSVVRVSQASAPDPEAPYDEPTASDDTAVQRKLVQFGLVELLKTYMLSLSTPENSGLWLALRLREKSEARPSTSRIRMYTEDEQLKERDLIVGRICALSRDIGIKDEDLLGLVSAPVESHPPPLDFEEAPKTADEIPLERHGALLLLAARSSAATLFGGAETARIPLYPDLEVIMSNFVGTGIADGAADEQAQALHDALLALTIISSKEKSENPADDRQFTALVLALTKCSYRQAYNGLRNVPAVIVHSHPSEIARFRLIQDIMQKEELLYARESAISWLKDEILTAAKAQNNNDNIFIDPQHFSEISSSLYNASEIESLDMSAGMVISWIRFSQSLAPYLHSALNLYYLILSSSQLRVQLKIENEYTSFRKNFLEPLKSTCHAFEEDLVQNGGDGRIEAVLGEDMCQVGMTQSVGLLRNIIEQVDEQLSDLYGDRGNDALKK